MKKFTSTERNVYWGGHCFTEPKDVQIDDVLRVLSDWEQGTVEAQEVMAFAEGLSRLGGGWPQYPPSNPNAVLYAVLEALEMLFIDPTLLRDVPVLCKALRHAQGSPEAAWNKLQEYWSQIDWQARSNYVGSNYPD